MNTVNTWVEMSSLATAFSRCHHDPEPWMPASPGSTQQGLSFSWTFTLYRAVTRHFSAWDAQTYLCLVLFYFIIFLPLWLCALGGCPRLLSGLCTSHVC